MASQAVRDLENQADPRTEGEYLSRLVPLVSLFPRHGQPNAPSVFVASRARFRVSHMGPTDSSNDDEGVVDTESPDHEQANVGAQHDKSQGDELERSDDSDDPARIARIDVLWG